MKRFSTSSVSVSVSPEILPETTLTAPYSRWKDVVQGELDPIKGMMQGKLRVRGDLPTIVRYVQAANELVRLTGRIDTQFPDEA